MNQQDILDKTFDAIFKAFGQIYADDPDPDLQERLRRKIEESEKNVKR